MKTKILLTILLVVSIGVNAGAIIVLMKQGRSGKDTERGWHCKALRGGFHLTREQAETLEQSRLAMIGKTAEIRSEMRRHRRDLLDLYHRDSVAEPALDSVLALLVREQVALEKEVFRHMCEVRDRLDPGQRELLYRRLTEGLCPNLEPGCVNECPEHIKQ